MANNETARGKKLVGLGIMHNGWDWNKAADHLALALEGKALQVLANQPLTEPQNPEKLIAALYLR